MLDARFMDVKEAGMARKKAVRKAGKKKPARKAGRSKQARKAVGRKAPARRSGAAVKRKTKARSRKPKVAREYSVLDAILRKGNMGED